MAPPMVLLSWLKNVQQVIPNESGWSQNLKPEFLSHEMQVWQKQQESLYHSWMLTIGLRQINFKYYINSCCIFRMLQWLSVKLFESIKSQTGKLSRIQALPSLELTFHLYLRSTGQNHFTGCLKQVLH